MDILRVLAVDTVILKSDPTIGGVIYLVINVLSGLVVVGAVIGIVFMGYQYLTAGDDVAKVKKSKMRLFQIVLGLALYGLLYAGIQFLIPSDVSDLQDLPTSETGTGAAGGSGGEVGIASSDEVDGEAIEERIEDPVLPSSQEVLRSSEIYVPGNAGFKGTIRSAVAAKGLTMYPTVAQAELAESGAIAMGQKKVGARFITVDAMTDGRAAQAQLIDTTAGGLEAKLAVGGDYNAAAVCTGDDLLSIPECVQRKIAMIADKWSWNINNCHNLHYVPSAYDEVCTLGEDDGSGTYLFSGTVEVAEKGPDDQVVTQIVNCDNFAKVKRVWIPIADYYRFVHASNKRNNYGLTIYDCAYGSFDLGVSCDLFTPSVLRYITGDYNIPFKSIPNIKNYFAGAYGRMVYPPSPSYADRLTLWTDVTNQPRQPGDVFIQGDFSHIMIYLEGDTGGMVFAEGNVDSSGRGAAGTTGIKTVYSAMPWGNYYRYTGVRRDFNGL